MKIKALTLEHLQKRTEKSAEVPENKLLALLSVRQRVCNLLKISCLDCFGALKNAQGSENKGVPKKRARAKVRGAPVSQQARRRARDDN
jgi:hypothetical protein